MKQHLVIDGYNLLGVMKKSGLVEGRSLESARETLLNALTRYHFQSGTHCTVVFDAWRQSHGMPQTEHRSGVTVIFTRHGERADQVLQRQIRAQSPACVVVSSDHEIIDTARAYGALVMRSEEFFRKLRGSERPVRSDRMLPDRAVEDKENGRRSEKKGNPRKLPKKVRQRIRALRRF